MVATYKPKTTASPASAVGDTSTVPAAFAQAFVEPQLPANLIPFRDRIDAVFAIVQADTRRELANHGVTDIHLTAPTDFKYALVSKLVATLGAARPGEQVTLGHKTVESMMDTVHGDARREIGLHGLNEHDFDLRPVNCGTDLQRRTCRDIAHTLGLTVQSF